jgi:hypothetical protein
VTHQPRLAVVTGASSGIGAALVRLLSRRGEPVLAVARRSQRLDALAGEALASDQAPIHPLALDLATDGAAQVLAHEARRRGVPWLLVNSAGFGAYGPFEASDPARMSALVRLNCEALVAASHALLPDVRGGGGGTVLNVASAAAFQPTPYMAVYGASKAFVLSFTEALDEELRGSGVRALAFCPGPVATEFGEVAGTGHRFDNLPVILAAEAAAAAALAQVDGGEAVTVPGPLTRAAATLAQVLPRGVIRRVSSRLLKPGDKP